MEWNSTRALRNIKEIELVTALDVVGPRIPLVIDRQMGQQVPADELQERGLHGCEALLLVGCLDECLGSCLPRCLSLGEDGVDVGCGDVRRARLALEHGCEVRDKDSGGFDGAVASLASNWLELEGSLVS